MRCSLWLGCWQSPFGAVKPGMGAEPLTKHGRKRVGRSARSKLEQRRTGEKRIGRSLSQQCCLGQTISQQPPNPADSIKTAECTSPHPSDVTTDDGTSTSLTSNLGLPLPESTNHQAPKSPAATSHKMRSKRLFLLATPLCLATALPAPHSAPLPPSSHITEVAYPAAAAAAARDDQVINSESASDHTSSGGPDSKKDDDAWKAADVEQLGARVSSTGEECPTCAPPAPGALNRSTAHGVSLKDLERGAVVFVGVVVAVGLALWGW